MRGISVLLGCLVCSFVFGNAKADGLSTPFEQFKKLPEVQTLLKSNSIKDIPNVLSDTGIYHDRFETIGFQDYAESIELVNKICDQYPQLIQIMIGTNVKEREQIKEVLRNEGVPEYFVYLIPALSGYNTKTVSEDGKLGYWHLPYHVSARCGDKMDQYVDERLKYNMVEQSECAAWYLLKLHDVYKNWELAAQAYIHNPPALNRGIERAGTYTALLRADTLLPAETRKSYYVFQALAYLHEYGAQHGLTPIALTLSKPTIHNSLLVSDNMYMEPFTKVTGIMEDSVKYYNPELRQNVIPKGFDLKLPAKQLAIVESMCDSLFHYQDSVYQREKITYYIANKEKIIESRKVFTRPPGVAKVLYTVKSGDNLGFIADWYDVGLSKLQYWNGIRGTRIYAGQTLVIYVPQSKEDYYAQIETLSFGQKQKLDGHTVIGGNSPRKKHHRHKTPAKKETKKPQYDPSKKYITYTVKSGDNLWLIAKKYPGVSSQNIMDLNGIDENLQPGQVLRIKEK